MSAHETFAREHEVRGSSDRTFGLVFSGFFLAIGFLPLLRGHAARWWAAPPALLFLLVAMTRPAILRPLNKLWIRLGLLLQKIVSPIILGVLFYLVITPLGFLYKRILGRDLLRLRKDSTATSYWITRQPPGPPPGDMVNQF